MSDVTVVSIGTQGPQGPPGTGIPAPTAVGQIPIGNSGDTYTPATLTQGTGIAITDASGSITIASTITQGAPPSATYVTTANEVSPLPNSVRLIQGSNITLTPGTNTLTISASSSGTGTVTQVNTGTGLTGGPITTTGTVSIANQTPTTLAGYNNSGVFSDVAIGSGLSFDGTTLVANGGGGGAPTTSTYLTAVDETADLPNSIKLLGTQTGTGCLALDPTGAAIAIGTNNVAIGPNAQATGTSDGLAMGPGAVCSGSDSMAIGPDAAISQDFSVAIGPGTTDAGASAGSNVIIGRAASVTSGQLNTVIGYSASINGSGFASVALGPIANSSGTESVAIGHASTDDGLNLVFSIGSTGEARDLIHINHLCGGSANPSTAGGAAAGAGATVTRIGTDLAGQITVTTAGTLSRMLF